LENDVIVEMTGINIVAIIVIACNNVKIDWGAQAVPDMAVRL
jgi:hypothetical protein